MEQWTKVALHFALDPKVDPNAALLIFSLKAQDSWFGHFVPQRAGSYCGICKWRLKLQHNKQGIYGYISKWHICDMCYIVWYCDIVLFGIFDFQFTTRDSMQEREGHSLSQHRSYALNFNSSPKATSRSDTVILRPPAHVLVGIAHMQISTHDVLGH